MSIPQRAAAIAYRGGHHVALREEVTAQTISDLAASI
jgi:hypothetical protein